MLAAFASKGGLVLLKNRLKKWGVILRTAFENFYENVGYFEQRYFSKWTSFEGGGLLKKNRIIDDIFEERAVYNMLGAKPKF